MGPLGRPARHEVRAHPETRKKGREASTPQAGRLRVPLAPLSMTMLRTRAEQYPLCHVERSSEESAAILTAQSKHPYRFPAPSTGTTLRPGPTNADSVAQSTQSSSTATSPSIASPV